MLLVAALAAAFASFGAQDAVTTLPDVQAAVRERVGSRCPRALRAEREAAGPHPHSVRSAYAYLNDAGPVIFRHGEGTAAVR